MKHLHANTRINPLLLSLLTIFSATAMAAKPAPAADPCEKQNNTFEINECAAATLKLKDAELNEAYQALMKSLTSDDKTDTTDYAAVRRQLQTAQRAWVQFRDADCNAMYDYNITGSIRNVVMLNCKIDRTVQRTKELRSWSRLN